MGAGRCGEGLRKPSQLPEVARIGRAWGEREGLERERENKRSEGDGFCSGTKRDETGGGIEG